jgi:hypothetical protein
MVQIYTTVRPCGLDGLTSRQYGLQVMTDLPHTRDHLTLWLNVMFGVSLAISGFTRVLHHVAFLSAHTLVVAYLILLYFVGQGELPNSLC